MILYHAAHHSMQFSIDFQVKCNGLKIISYYLSDQQVAESLIQNDLDLLKEIINLLYILSQSSETFKSEAHQVDLAETLFNIARIFECDFELVLLSVIFFYKF